ncbi:Holliday junction branch migration protein RuvA [Levilactobacillus bambusae]|uniref:Holliday junction branch migration complex subunit RuvA n=1 Tax=Levilactobacillus bambusae TaxID=2024736 RepID=A0A2V1MX24_9LACO|nr:Holliday junction branch migration protein RuvA [Levilactobacillus bambusae]PWF99578.1 Holliday junction branch migration protein RuvA [Levilactobacillus bambusae]
MFEYLKGAITAVLPDHIVVEVNGVGYYLNTANPYQYQEGQTEVVYVYQAVSDSAITLYGFTDAAEKALFLTLIKVSGIGPKSALAILAGNADHQGLINAINTENITYLTKFPGVGKKTAAQIVLDLKGKLAPKTANVELLADEGVQETGSPVLDDALAALKALGYKETAVKKITPKLAKMGYTTTNDYLSAGLKLLTNS